MEHITLPIEERSGSGKGPARRLRASGKLPGVLYGLGKSASVTVDPKTIEKTLLEEGGKSKIFTLKGAGTDGRFAMIREYQVDPLSRKLVHVDLLEVDIKQKITVKVKLNLVGRPLGVADGGVLNIIAREIEVRCLPNTIPKHIDVNVEPLKIGDSIHLDALTLPEGVEKTSQTNQTLVTVVPPAKEEELAPSLTPTAEPEVITEKKAAEEGAEGAEAGKGGAKDAKAAAKPAAGESKKEEKKK